MSETEAFARVYAASGYHVFPVVPRDKRPLVAWSTEATVDDNQIHDWWSRWPDAGIGIALGPSGLVVLDVDPRNGGNESYQQIRDQLPATGAVQTGGGGLHLYYEGIRRTQPNRLPGIDIKASGGYVVAPPSVHPSGRQYEWIRPTFTDLWAPWPDWLDQPEPEPVSVPPTPVTGDLHRYVRAAVVAELDALLGCLDGTCNDLLNRAAFSLGQWVGGGHLAQVEAQRMLADAASRVFASDPRRLKAAAATIRSGLTSGCREPRVVIP